MYVYTCNMYTCIYVHNTCTCKCMYTCTCIYVHVYMYIHLHVYMHVHCILETGSRYVLLCIAPCIIISRVQKMLMVKVLLWQLLSNHGLPWSKIEERWLTTQPWKQQNSRCSSYMMSIRSYLERKRCVGTTVMQSTVYSRRCEYVLNTYSPCHMLMYMYMYVCCTSKMAFMWCGSIFTYAWHARVYIRTNVYIYPVAVLCRVW